MIKIIDIKVTKKAIILFFDNEEELNISINTKNEFFLYVGKEISKQTLKEIKHYEANTLHLNYAIKLLSRMAYTAFEIKEKLRKRAVDEEVIKEIIKKLQDFKLLDDLNYAKEKVQYLINVKGASKKAIINELKRRGINYHTIEDVISAIPAFEVEELMKKIPKLINRYHKESLKAASLKINQKLYNDGYLSENINEALSHFKLEDYIDEDKNIEIYYELVMKSERRKGKNDIKVVYNKLSKAGYPHHKITLILKEQINED